MLKQLFIFFIISAFHAFAGAQNLVPNGDFEKMHILVADWVQPLGEFYHHEDMWLDTNGHKAYNHLNGLCLINPEPSEYMYAKLKQPIEAGKTYCIKFKVFFKNNSWDNPASLKKVEFAFLNEARQMYRRIRIFADPDLSFNLDTLTERPFWQYFDTTFTATHSAGYIYIGRFFNDSIMAAFENATVAREILLVELEETLRQVTDTFGGRMIQISEAKTKRELKRQTRLLHDFTKSNRLQRDSIIKAIKNAYSYKVDSANYVHLHNYYFQVRAYFDDICIAPFRTDGSCNCSDTAAFEKQFVAGKKYALKGIYFDLDKATLKPESFVELNNLLKILNDYPTMEIRINGHTDSINSYAYNLKLSDNRSKAVVSWLVAHGISASRLRWKGFGESQPVTSNATQAGRAVNRRVEFEVVRE